MVDPEGGRTRDGGPRGRATWWTQRAGTPEMVDLEGGAPEMVDPEGGRSWPWWAASGTHPSSMLNTHSLSAASTTCSQHARSFQPPSSCHPHRSPSSWQHNRAKPRGLVEAQSLQLSQREGAGTARSSQHCHNDHRAVPAEYWTALPPCPLAHARFDGSW